MFVLFCVSLFVYVSELDYDRKIEICQKSLNRWKKTIQFRKKNKNRKLYDDGKTKWQDMKTATGNENCWDEKWQEMSWSIERTLVASNHIGSCSCSHTERIPDSNTYNFIQLLWSRPRDRHLHETLSFGTVCLSVLQLIKFYCLCCQYLIDE